MLSIHLALAASCANARCLKFLSAFLAIFFLVFSLICFPLFGYRLVPVSFVVFHAALQTPLISLLQVISAAMRTYTVTEIPLSAFFFVHDFS
jgi:hypothetical protein